MKYLIVNADDFGLAESVNVGIIKAHKEGIVTSTTLLACGEAAEQAVSLAGENPGLGVGLHLCLTRERPVLDPSKVKGITNGGRFLHSPVPLMTRLAAGLANVREIEAELRAQVERALSLGIKPTHFDGHQHVHVLPGIAPITARLAREYGVPAVRCPVGPWVETKGIARVLEKAALEVISCKGRKSFKTAGLVSPENFFGLARTGTLDTDSIRGIMTRLPEGTNELMCHPGTENDPLARATDWGFGWKRELDALTDAGVGRLLRDSGVKLASYSVLSGQTSPT